MKLLYILDVLSYSQVTLFKQDRKTQIIISKNISESGGKTKEILNKKGYDKVLDSDVISVLPTAFGFCNIYLDYKEKKNE